MQDFTARNLSTRRVESTAQRPAYQRIAGFEERLARRYFYRSGMAATASISTSAPFGSAATWTALRAGQRAGKTAA